MLFLRLYFVGNKLVVIFMNINNEINRKIDVHDGGGLTETSWIRAVLNALFNFVTNKIFLDKYSYQTTCIFSLDP